MARQLELRHRNPIFGLQSLLASHASWSDTRVWISKLILLFGLQGLIWILWSRNQPFSRPGLQRRSWLTRYHLFVSRNPDFPCSLSSACSSIRRTEGFWVLRDGWRVEGWLLSVVTGSAPLSAAWLLLCLRLPLPAVVKACPQHLVPHLTQVWPHPDLSSLSPAKKLLSKWHRPGFLPQFFSSRKPT